MKRNLRFLLGASCALVLLGCATPASEPMTMVAMRSVAPRTAGAEVGTIMIHSMSGHIALMVDLHGLSPGEHGMHVHANASCESAVGSNGEMTPAGAAGAHYDPAQSGHHEGPDGNGHLGDLPRLHVDAQGNARETLMLTRVHSIEDLNGRAIIIHANGDNYSDTPAPLGGGGARVACGVIG
ncbi:MAG: superoxide dismutase family protein [Alphaproteobacteria bacterium]|nr:superoxide dismutase family protein [Alphaproteobacteria bacterium]